MDKTEVLIVGGGAAGMFAAASAALAGAAVVLLEKNNRLGRKLSLTGGGRGNLTNTADLQDFIKNVPGNGSFLFSALSRFSSADCREFLHRIGIPTKEESGGRVFPVEEQADKVVEAMESFLISSGVRIIPSAKVTGLILEDNVCRGVLADANRRFFSPSVVLACGGASYPHTGSTGDGYLLAEQAGHRVTPRYPSLVPLCLGELELCQKLQGLSIHRAGLKLTTQEGEKIGRDQGEIIFTHFGLSGPAALRLSRAAAKHMHYSGAENRSLSIDFLPARKEEEVAAFLSALASLQPQKTVLSALRELLPRRLAEICFAPNQNIGRRLSGSMGKKEWLRLVRQMKNLPLTLTGTRPLSEAMVTVGGVDVKEINPQTMASRLIKGLYFAGELLDLDAYTGGFNLQTAFSTGWVAGRSAAEPDRGTVPLD